jgi:threonylcarbamoyladenosine tRNA methylthiotransferase MtaB
VNKLTKKKIAFHTLGCKLNFTETSTISRLFPEDQFERVPSTQKADIYVINTCSVTDTANKKCRQAIKKFIHRSPHAFIVVIGCYVQLNPQEITSIPGVDLVLGSNEKFDISYYLPDLRKRNKPEVHSSDLSPSDPFINSYSAGDRTRSFLKVQDGCDYRCTYCTVPLARGRSRNADMATLVNEATIIADKGIKELVLTGVNIGDFGKSTGDTFAELLKKLVKVSEIERIRLSSIEPDLLSDEIIELVQQNKKLLPHFHIPAQSGSDKILGLMGRRYRRDLFADRVKTIKALIPLAGIGADIITGFPGENKTDFEDTFSFIEKLPVSYLHVFTFSERPGTRAAGFPDKVKHEEKEKRTRKLISLSELKHNQFLNMNIGKTEEVLFEKTRSNGMISGFTGNYIRSEYRWQSQLPGKIKKVRMKDISPSGKMIVELI